MTIFWRKSQSRLDTVDKRLQRVFIDVIKYYDCAILEGYRNKERQNELFEEGKTNSYVGVAILGKGIILFLVYYIKM